MTTISDSPVIYTSFLSVKLAAKPPVPNALPSILAVSNPPPEQRAFLRKDTLAAAPAVSGSAYAPAAPSANAAAAGGDWKCFVDHLQQQGSVPGAAADDPERGVVTPANVSVKQMLAFLRNQAPSKPAWADAPLRQPSASMPSRGPTVPIPQGSDAASAEPEAASPATLLQQDDPMVASDPSGTAVLRDDMERQHEAADPQVEPAQSQLLDDDQALHEELRMWEQTYRPYSGELHTVHEEAEEDPVELSNGFGTMYSVFHEDRYDQPTHAEMREAFWTDLGRDDASAEPLASGSFWGDLVRYNEPAEPGVGEAFLQLQQLQKLQELHRKMEAALRHNQQLKEEVGVYF